MSKKYFTHQIKTKKFQIAIKNFKNVTIFYKL